MNKQEKSEELEKLKGIFSADPLVLVCQQKGLTVEDSNFVRRACRNEKVGFKVSKNTLLRMAVAGTSYEHLQDKFSGPTVISWSEDPLAAARTISKFAKDNEGLSIVCGANAEGALSAENIKELANLPPMDVLRAKIIGLISTPATNLARVIPAVAGGIARLVAQKPDSPQTPNSAE